MVLIFTLIISYPLLWIHELGHALAAWSMGIRVTDLHFSNPGRHLGKIPWLNTNIYVGFSSKGQITHQNTCCELKQFFITAAGPAIECILVFVAYLLLDLPFSMMTWEGSFYQTLIEFSINSLPGMIILFMLLMLGVDNFTDINPDNNNDSSKMLIQIENFLKIKNHKLFLWIRTIRDLCLIFGVCTIISIDFVYVITH